MLAGPRSCTAGWTEGANAAFLAVTGASLLAMAAAPVLLGWWTDGSPRRRVGRALVLVLALCVAAVPLAVGNFVLGNGCGGPWRLIALNALPALLLGALLVTAWRSSRERAAQRAPRPQPGGGWALLLTLQGFVLASGFALLGLVDVFSRASRKADITLWLVALRLWLVPLLLGLLAWWLWQRRQRARAADAVQRQP
ncbi:hypothetical protein C7H73_08495 [Pulveribacter suum]|uniref:Uncharacterized protein n=1 Tax=Pulveribacter suum TaxID=2116657 RepID=A0A2P1NKY8_9BURK|nr:hypothetical protein C7H73_08495 [Pulveribacter suum]